MPRNNKTKYAILGLLQIKPMSGYDMKKMIDRSLSFFWNENYGHLYPVLSKMEKQGLIKKSVTKGEKRPDRFVYEITDSGKKELKGWFPKPNDEVKFRSELLLKLFFGPQAEKQILISMLEQEKKQHEKMLSIYDDLENQIRGNDYREVEKIFWHFTLQNGRFYSRAQIDWCDETLKAMKLQE